MDRVDKLVQDFKIFEEQFPDLCLVKKLVSKDSDEYEPSHFVFTFYSDVSLLHMKATLNKDNKTYQVSSTGKVLINKIRPENIRTKLESMKIQTGLTGAIHSDYKITSFER